MTMNTEKSQVIPFPKSKSARVIMRKNRESRQAMTSLGVLSFVLVAVFLNEHVLSSGRPNYVVSDNSSSSSLSDLNRAIASSRPMNPLRDLEWEQGLAKKLASTELKDRSPASFGRSVSSLDQIRFGTLAGKYRIGVDENEKLREIDYIESLDSGDRPQFVDRADFLRSYRSSMSIPFARFELAKADGTTEVYLLKNDADQVVGQAQFRVDDEGRFLHLGLSRLNSN